MASLRAKIFAVVLPLVVALVAASLVVVDRRVEADLRDALRAQLQGNSDLFVAVQRATLERVELQSRMLAQGSAIKSMLTNPSLEPKDYPPTLDPLIERTGLANACVYDRRRRLMYPPARIGDPVFSALPEVALAIPAPPNDVDPPPPPEPVPPRVVAAGGSLFLLATFPCLEKFDEGYESVGAIVAFEDLETYARALREIAGAEAHVALAAGTTVLRSTYDCEARRTELAVGLALHERTIERVERGLERSALVEVAIGGSRHLVLLASTLRAPGEARAPGTIAIIRPFGSVLEEQMDRIRLQLLATGAVALVIAAVLVALFARSLSRPIARLAAGMEQVAAGDLDVAVEPSTSDEVGSLTRRFNEMVVGLRQKELFKKMVSTTAAEEVERSGRTKRILKLGGKVERVTVLFSDIRDFTPLTEKLGAGIVSLINEYFAVAGGIIAAHGGDIDKFIGDAVMVVFRDGELARGDGARRAVRCAAAMVAAVPAFNATGAGRGWPPISIGVGVATGYAVAGNVGTPDRMENTVLGDTVNVAARLETESKNAERVPVMLDQATRELAGAEIEVTARTAHLKGKAGETPVFELVSVRQE